MTPAEGNEHLKTLPADEPVFVLRAKDKFAPAAIRSWAVMCLAQSSFNEQKNVELAATRAKGERAMELVTEIQEYQREHGSKLPG